MIGSAGTGASFGGLASYLMREDEAGERVAWTATRNLFGGEEHAVMLMEATAAQNVRVQKPVYHLSLSAAPGEELTPEEWQRAADRVLRDLGLEEHQALLVAHRDSEHQHLHVMVNRVHTETLKTWDNSHDYRRIEKSLRHLERDWRLKEVPGRHFQLDGQERPEHGRRLTAGEQREAERTGREPWAERVRLETLKDFKEAKSWGELEKRLEEQGLALQKRGRGLVVTDGERMVKASRVDRGSSFAQLGKRFGQSFDEWREERGRLLDATERLQKTERVRTKLGRREFRQRQEVVRLRGDIKHAQHAKDLSRQQAREVTYRLRFVYQPEHHRQAVRRLVEVARREGWEKAATRLRDEPERFGPLPGRAIGSLETRLRKEVRQAARWAALDVGDMAKVRAGRAQALAEAKVAQQLLPAAMRRLARTARILQALPSRQPLERQVLKLAMRIGLEVAQRALPKPAALVVRAAVEAARVVGREMEQ